MADFLEAVESKDPKGMSDALSRHYEASESMEGEGNPGNPGSY